MLTGMGLSDALAASSLRFSVGRFTTEAEIEQAAARVAAAVERLRAYAFGAARVVHDLSTALTEHFAVNC